MIITIPQNTYKLGFAVCFSHNTQIENHNVTIHPKPIYTCVCARARCYTFIYGTYNKKKNIHIHLYLVWLTCIYNVYISKSKKKTSNLSFIISLSSTPSLMLLLQVFFQSRNLNFHLYNLGTICNKYETLKWDSQFQNICIKYTHFLTKVSSFRFVISAKAEARASSFPAVAEATSSDLKLDSCSSSETLFLRERSSTSSDFFSLSACT